jgi:hypothetical protein
MNEEEGDRPRPSGIRSYFKPITVDQAREQHDRVAEKSSKISQSDDEPLCKMTKRNSHIVV